MDSGWEPTKALETIERRIPGLEEERWRDKDEDDDDDAGETVGN